MPPEPPKTFKNRPHFDQNSTLPKPPQEAPQLALYAYMLVCIYAVMQKCMHTLMKCTASLGHGKSSMQKRGAPVTRPVGVLDIYNFGWLKNNLIFTLNSIKLSRIIISLWA